MNKGVLNGVSNWLTDILNSIQAAVMVLLPNSPFANLALPPEIAQYLPYVNWVIPFYMIVPTFAIWCGAVVVYYAYHVILRWVKAIG